MLTFEEGNALVPFANFGTVEFTSAAAGTLDGAILGTTGSTLIDIVSSSGQILTSTSTPSESEIIVQSQNSWNSHLAGYWTELDDDNIDGLFSDSGTPFKNISKNPWQR